MPSRSAARVVAASAVAAASRVTIGVVLGAGQPTSHPGTEAALHTLARVIAARVGRTPPATDTAPLSIAHAVAIERDSLTRELTDHFAQHLETILGHLRDAAAHDSAQRIHWAATEASRALADLRERRALWQQARRVDEAFAVGRARDRRACPRGRGPAGVHARGAAAAGRREHGARRRGLDHPRRRAERERAFGRPRGDTSPGR